MDEKPCDRTEAHGAHGWMAPIDSQAEVLPPPVFLQCPGVPGDRLVEAVDHPAHYGGADDPYEAIKVIRAWDLGFNLGNTVKYIARAGKKDPAKHLEDLKKALWYLNDEIETLEKQ